MAAAFDHALVELAAVPGDRLSDAGALSALLVAAAGAVGMPPHAPPVVGRAMGTLTVGLLCREGHIVLHAAPADGFCVIDIVARAPAPVAKGIEVIRRRLEARPERSGGSP